MKENSPRPAVPARRVVFWLLAGVFLIFSGPLQAASAQSSGDMVLYYLETFDSANAPGWDQEALANGEWEISGGYLTGHPDSAVRYLRANLSGPGVLTLNLVPNDISKALEVGILTGAAGPGFRMCFYHLESGLNHYLYAEIKENAEPGCEAAGGDMVYKSVRFHKGLHYDLKIGISSGLIYADLDLAMKGTPRFRTYHDFELAPRKAHDGGSIYLATPLRSTVRLDGIAFYGPKESAAYYLDGYAREGSDPAAGKGIPNAVIRLYGSDKPYPELSLMIAQTLTRADGYFELLAPLGYDYYAVTEDNPGRYESVQAFSPGGTARTADWVELERPAWSGSGMEPIVFLDVLPTAVPPLVSTRTPQPARTRAPALTPTPTNTALPADLPGHSAPFNAPLSPVILAAASGALVGGYYLARGRRGRRKE